MRMLRDAEYLALTWQPLIERRRHLLMEPGTWRLQALEDFEAAGGQDTGQEADFGGPQEIALDALTGWVRHHAGDSAVLHRPSGTWPHTLAAGGKDPEYYISREVVL